MSVGGWVGATIVVISMLGFFIYMILISYWSHKEEVERLKNKWMK